MSFASKLVPEKQLMLVAEWANWPGDEFPLVPLSILVLLCFVSMHKSNVMSPILFLDC